MAYVCTKNEGRLLSCSEGKVPVKEQNLLWYRKIV